MSLASIIAYGLAEEGVSFKKDGEKLSTHDVQEILKNHVIMKLLTSPQGGNRIPEKYFCDRCARQVTSG